MGEEEGNSIGVLDAMRGGIRKREGKNKCGEVRMGIDGEDRW
jgi:hypothetical protein